MASASTWHSLGLLRSLSSSGNRTASLSSSGNRTAFTGMPPPSHLVIPRCPLFCPFIASARRRGNPVQIVSSSSSRQKIKKKKNRDEPTSEDEPGEDPFEALFKQLEEDLKNDQSEDDNEDDISEQDLVRLEKELEEALAEDENLSDLLKSLSDDFEGEGNDGVGQGEIEELEEVNENEDDDDEEEEPKFKLKGWQLRQLAYALKKGRRKTNIKELAAEVCLDRPIVLELLRNPPPRLLMMSAALPDKPKPTTSVPADEPTESFKIEPPTTEPSSSEETSKSVKPKSEVKGPIHALQGRWSAQKRLKKVHLDTLERVYRRSKRPSNAIVSSIVQVTNLPRKKILKWFEDKRAEEGVPNDLQRRPYNCAASQSEPAYTRFSNIRDTGVGPT